MSTLGRWRLVLGKAAEEEGLPSPDSASEIRADQLLEFLFEGPEGPAAPASSPEGAAEPGEGADSDGEGKAQGSSPPAGKGKGKGKSGSRQGGRGGPTFQVPDWVEKVRELFPTAAKEVMEKELLQRRGLTALLQEPRLLERLEPNLELAKVLISHRGLLNQQTRPMARRLIESVVEQIKQRLKVAVEPVLSGAIRRDRHSPRPSFRNLDLRRTVWRNLQHYDAEHERLLVERVHYFAAERKNRPWHVIVVVDQSGSMMDSAVFSAIMASIFAALPALRTSLLVFADSLADLSDKVHDPVEVLMSAQLGGGTNIAGALAYAAELVREPKRTILVLVSDFEEGASVSEFLKRTELLADSGVRMIGLGALSYEGRPAYSKYMALELRRRGMDVLSCTPEELADCMARIIRG